MKIEASQKLDFNSDKIILLVLRPFSINPLFMQRVEKMFIKYQEILAETKKVFTLIFEEIISKNEYFQQRLKEYSKLFPNLLFTSLTQANNSNFLNYLTKNAFRDSKEEKQKGILIKEKY